MDSAKPLERLKELIPVNVDWSFSGGTDVHRKTVCCVAFRAQLDWPPGEGDGPLEGHTPCVLFNRFFNSQLVTGQAASDLTTLPALSQRYAFRTKGDSAYSRVAAVS